MDAQEAARLGHEITDGDLDCWTPDHVEAVRLLTSVAERARSIAFHDGPLWSVPIPELHWIGQWILKGDPD